MKSDHQKKCTFCNNPIHLTDEKEVSLFAVAGEWLADDVWNDKGDLCKQCLENRGKLAMMYLHDKNR